MHIQPNLRFKEKGEVEEGEKETVCGRDEEATRTNMFWPVGASLIGVVASVSFTVSFSGSLSPGWTWRAARRAATCAWAVLAALVAMLAMTEAIFVYFLFLTSSV